MRPWIKFHTTTLDDVRILRLNERQQLRYFQMYLLAGRLNADGLFIENNERLSDADIALKLRVSDTKQFAADLAALKKANLIKVNGHGPYIEAFSREQVDWSLKQQQDRERKQKQRHGDVTRDGSVTSGKSRKGHGNVTPLDQKKIKKEKEKKKEIKNPPPPTPASSKRLDSGGGGEKKKVSSPPPTKKNTQAGWLSSLHGDAKLVAEIMLPILTSSGLGIRKIETLLPKVATRITPPDAKRYTLAALASSFSDPDVKNPAMAAAYRIENDSVPVQFMMSETWSKLPPAILKAANIDLERLPRNTSSSTTQRSELLRKAASNVGN